MDRQQQNLDQIAPIPTFSNSEIVERYQDGTLSRAEAEAFDTLYTATCQGGEKTSTPSLTTQQPAIIYIDSQGSSTIFTLSDFPKGPTSMLQKMNIAAQAGRATIDFIVSLLEQLSQQEY